MHMCLCIHLCVCVYHNLSSLMCVQEQELKVYRLSKNSEAKNAQLMPFTKNQCSVLFFKFQTLKCEPLEVF